jgi:hypothetical protein
MPTAANIAGDLSAPERELLSCLASRMDWRQAGVTPTTVQIALVKNLVARGHAGSLALTHQGHAVATALLWAKQS